MRQQQKSRFRIFTANATTIESRYKAVDLVAARLKGSNPVTEYAIRVIAIREIAIGEEVAIS
jgi:hypothetical protein